MNKHKHFDLILSFANGSEIEHLNRHGIWEYIQYPSWHDDFVYRIKPEPKTDIVLYAYSAKCKNDNYAYMTSAWGVNNSNFGEDIPNIKLTYDGETKELKSAEKI